MGDQPFERPIPTHRAAQTQNKRIQTSMPRVWFETHDTSVRAGECSLWLRPRGQCDLLNYKSITLYSKIALHNFVPTCILSYSLLNQLRNYNVRSFKIIFGYSITVSRYTNAEEIVYSIRNDSKEEHADFAHTYIVSSWWMWTAKLSSEWTFNRMAIWHVFGVNKSHIAVVKSIFYISYKYFMVLSCAWLHISPVIALTLRKRMNCCERQHARNFTEIFFQLLFNYILSAQKANLWTWRIEGSQASLTRSLKIVWSSKIDNFSLG
jgi:hypothetical protein